MNKNSEQYKSYIAYLKTQKWRNVKTALLKERGCVCEVCNKPFKSAKGLEVHHLTYERLYHEKSEDLQILCKHCHMATHGLVEDIHFKFIDGSFVKSFVEPWKYLLRVCSPLEFKCVHMLTLMLEFNTNKLGCLSDKTPGTELMEVWGISCNMVGKVKARLKELGIIAQYQKHWHFNCFLSVNGKYVDNEVADLFRETEIAKVFYTTTVKPD